MRSLSVAIACGLATPPPIAARIVELQAEASVFASSVPGLLPGASVVSTARLDLRIPDASASLELGLYPARGSTQLDVVAPGIALACLAEVIVSNDHPSFDDALLIDGVDCVDQSGAGRQIVEAQLFLEDSTRQALSSTAQPSQPLDLDAFDAAEVLVDFTDGTEFEANITTLVPEPEPGAGVAAALLALAAGRGLRSRASRPPGWARPRR